MQVNELELVCFLSSPNDPEQIDILVDQSGSLPKTQIGTYDVHELGKLLFSQCVGYDSGWLRNELALADVRTEHEGEATKLVVSLSCFILLEKLPSGFQKISFYDIGRFDPRIRHTINRAIKMRYR